MEQIGIVQASISFTIMGRACICFLHSLTTTILHLISEPISSVIVTPEQVLRSASYL